MARYAEGTSVPVAKTRMELEELLTKRGGREIVTGTTTSSRGESLAFVLFRLSDRLIRFNMPLPTVTEVERDGRGARRSADAQAKALEQLARERWRALFVTIKSKFVAVDEQIETVEQAFLARIVLPSGGTVGERLAPELTSIYAGKAAPQLLLGPGAAVGGAA